MPGEPHLQHRADSTTYASSLASCRTRSRPGETVAPQRRYSRSYTPGSVNSSAPRALPHGNRIGRIRAGHRHCAVSHQIHDVLHHPGQRPGNPRPDPWRNTDKAAEYRNALGPGNVQAKARDDLVVDEEDSACCGSPASPPGSPARAECIRCCTSPARSRPLRYFSPSGSRPQQRVNVVPGKDDELFRQPGRQART